MSTRSNIDAATLTALQAANVNAFMLIELAFDSARVYLCDLPFDVDWGGHTYSAAQAIGKIEPITETDTESRGITFTLSAVPIANVSAALQEEVQGREALLRLAIVDGTTLRVDPCVWKGVMDVMTLDGDDAQPSIRVTAEHQLIAWQQPSGALFSDAEQQARYPGDKAFEFIAQIAEATISWPRKEFYQK